MHIEFESVKKFNFALREVLILVRYSKKNKYRNISNVFLKSALILLATKLEVFLESIFKNYIDFVNDKLTIEQIPIIIKLTHSKEMITKETIGLSDAVKTILKAQNEKDIISNVENINTQTTLLFNIWKNVNSMQKMEISNKFNYGEHGEKSINNLFRKIGIDKILDKIIVTEKQYTIDGEIDQDINFKAKFNTIVYKRNTIIHQDDNINFTSNEIEAYVRYCKQFSIKLARILKKLLNSYKKIKC